MGVCCSSSQGSQEFCSIGLMEKSPYHLSNEIMDVLCVICKGRIDFYIAYEQWTMVIPDSNVWSMRLVSSNVFYSTWIPRNKCLYSRRSLSNSVLRSMGIAKSRRLTSISVLKSYVLGFPLYSKDALPNFIWAWTEQLILCIWIGDRSCACSFWVTENWGCPSKGTARHSWLLPIGIAMNSLIQCICIARFGCLHSK